MADIWNTAPKRMQSAAFLFFRSAVYKTEIRKNPEATPALICVSS